MFTLSARPRPARAVWLGLRPYEPLHALQKALVERRASSPGAREDVVLLCEHEPVVTLGRGADAGHVLFGEAALAARGVALAATGRGGDVTYHGPGQLVAYPILDLRPDRCDVRRYVRALAEAMILILRDHHVEAGVVEGKVGAWVDLDAPGEWGGEAFARRLAKVGAIGVRLSRWVTMHGFALNLAPDMSHFGLIVPCGIREHPVTSLLELSGRAPTVAEVALGSARAFEQALGLRIEAVEDASSAALDALELE